MNSHLSCMLVKNNLCLRQRARQGCSVETGIHPNGNLFEAAVLVKDQCGRLKSFPEAKRTDMRTNPLRGMRIVSFTGNRPGMMPQASS